MAFRGKEFKSEKFSASKVQKEKLGVGAFVHFKVSHYM